MKFTIWIGVCGVMLASAGLAQAVEQTFDATGDVWVRDLRERLGVRVVESDR